MSPNQSLDTSDEDDGVLCVVCSSRKRNYKAVANLSKELISQIEESRSMKLDSNDIICNDDIQKYSMVTISFLKRSSGSEVIGRNHNEECTFCSKSLVLGENVASDDGEKEFIEHHHLTNMQGFVPHDKTKFVKFALRCKHRSTNQRVTFISSCICNSCYHILRRKFDSSEKGIYYTPSVRKKKLERQECCIKDCSDKSIVALEIIPAFFLGNFSVKESFIKSSSTSAPLCNHHRQDYRRKLLSPKLCMFCARDISRVSKKEKTNSQPSFKKKLVEDIQRKELALELPEDFINKEYTFHKNCLKQMKIRIARMNSPNTTPTKRVDYSEDQETGKRRRLDFGQENLEQESIPSTSSAQDASLLQHDDELEISVGFSDTGLDESLSTSHILEDEPNNDEQIMSKEEILSITDEETINFVYEKLQSNMFMTRKELVERWHDILKTKCFLQSIDYQSIPTLKIMTVQKRVMEKWNCLHGNEETLQFTFRSNRCGYYVHLASVDMVQFEEEIRKLKAKDFEEEDFTINEFGKISHVYKLLLNKIEANAKIIDDFYRIDGENISNDYDIKKLINLLDPMLFNFVVFTTLR